MTQGGGVAAPIASQVFGEVLPYLEIKKDNEQEEDRQEVEVPNIVGMTEKEAKKTLEDVGLNLEVKIELEDNQSSEKNSIEGNGEMQNLQQQNTEKTITEQLPKAGIRIRQGISIVAYIN